MADKTINELTAATTMGNDDLLVLQQGGTAKKLSGKQLGDYVYNAAAEKVAEVNKAIDDARSSINDIVESVQSMTELGTDTTLTTTGMAADAKAAGDKITQVEIETLAMFEPVEAEPGSIVTFEDGADNLPIKKLKIDIEPVQAGSGDPSPDNVRPISGWTGVKVAVAGKNIWDAKNSQLYSGGGGNVYASDFLLTRVKTETGFMATNRSKDYGICTLIGYVKAGQSISANYEAILPANVTNLPFLRYTNSVPATGSSVPYTNLPNDLYNERSRSALKVIAPVDGYYYLSVYATTTDNIGLSNVVVSFDNTIDKYEPYTGSTYEITFPSEAGTVYGGSLEINQDGTATLTVTDDVIVSYNGETLPSTWISDSGVYAEGTTPTTGAQVVYALSAPLVYTLTVPKIKTLLGLNNIWADTGDITEFVYRKAPADLSDIAKMESIIADKETTMTATKNYSSGGLVIVDHTLYKFDSNVASGETIIPDVNCYITTVEAELAEHVPNYRTVNGKALSSDITLTAEDVPYDDSLSDHTSGSVGKAVSDLKSTFNLNNLDYQAFTDIAWKRRTTGSSASSWGCNVASTTRICTGYIPADYFLYDAIEIIPKTGYKYCLYYLADDQGAFPYFSVSWSEEQKTYIIDSNTYIVILIAKTDNSEITTTDWDKVKVVVRSTTIKNLSDSVSIIADILNSGILEKQINKGYISAQNTANLFGWDSAHMVIPAEGFSTFTMLSNATRNTNYLFVSNYEKPLKNGDPYYPCDGYTRIVVPASTKISETIPSDCKYILICMASDVGDHSPQMVMLDNNVITIEAGKQIVGLGEDSYLDIKSSQAVLRANVDSLMESAGDTNLIEQSLFIGSVVNNQLDTNGNISTTQNSKIVSQVSALAVPYYDVEISVHMPDDYAVTFVYGTSTGNSYIILGTRSSRLHNGDKFSFSGVDQQIYRVFFEKDDGASDISAEVVRSLIDSGTIRLTYKDNSLDVVARNSGSEHYIKNIMRKFTGVLANDDSLTKMPVFTHTSDVHGDAIRTRNFLEYSDFLGVDAALISGDLVPMSGLYDRATYIDDLIDDHTVKTLLCMGNHDARGYTTKQAQNGVLANIIDKYSLVTPQSETYPTYYYCDFTNKAIRVIALNMYEAGQKDTNAWRYTQEQINWFITALSSTPEGYGVIVMMHAPEEPISAISGYDKFFQDGSVTKHGNFKPVTQIIDAFISKTTVNIEFQQETSGSTETITATADFSGVNSGVEFICYVSGHRHRDGIGYISGTTNKQLMCNVVLGFSLYGNSSYHLYAEHTDLPRGGQGVVQDCFNVYAIDRAAKTVRVARVGSNMKHDFTLRDYMIVPYVN